MKMAETLFGLMKICCSGYRHTPEAMGEAEGFFLPNATLLCKVTSSYCFVMYCGTSVFFFHPVEKPHFEM